jgi:hypothetical protein
MLPPLTNLAIRFMRGRAHQPGPTIPQSPGIILETSNGTLLNAAFHLRKVVYRGFNLTIILFCVAILR